MKHRIFFVDEEKLIEYLQKYGRGARSKDYEFAIALHAKTYWDKKLRQKHIIVFEQNNKMHNYPQRFSPTVEELKDILRTYNEENTPVDFALAPVSTADEFEGIAYPFQIKKYVPDTDEPDNSEFAAYISEKANKYRASDTCLIVFPEMLDKEDTKGFDITEVKKMLKIDNKSVRAVYGFQFFDDTPNFILLWASPEALSKHVSD